MKLSDVKICRILAFSLILSSSISDLNAQVNLGARFHEMRFSYEKDTLIQTQNTIVPSTVTLNSYFTGKTLPFSLSNNSIQLNFPGVRDSVYLQFRTIAYNLAESESVLDSTDILREDRVIRIENNIGAEGQYNRRIIENQKLEYSGSFSRGISFGNTQDVVLNSNFNLQMNGDLGNGLLVRAAISDDNIPIQPEGNTQVLQEFDKIFIEIQKDKTTLVAGDYELGRPDSYFMNYYKKLKGLSVQNSSRAGDWNIENKAGFAVSRGKFRRMTLPIVEGNQGPYKLQGDNGEVFLQVLSGTEKVFADGRLLKRGENFDYVIDYNRAEIKFTVNHLITANIRIIVEFEYAVQSYLRSLFASQSSISNDKWQFSLNFYNEQDSKTLSSNLELDTTDISILEESGDSPAFRSGIFIPNEETRSDLIKYRLDNNILVYSPEDDNDLVGAVFSNRGNSLGSYIIDNQAGANGRVYKYVGEDLGEYDPVIQLVAPEKRQLITMSGQYNLSDSTKFYIETGLSNRDFNRFSDIDNDNNNGIAIMGNISDNRRIGKRENWLLTSECSLEITDKNFESLNPYRVPEFNRDWNISAGQSRYQQRLFQSSFSLQSEKSGISYGLNAFDEEINYSGTKHQMDISHTNKGWLLSFSGNILDSETPVDHSSFLRPKFLLQKSILNEKWTFSFYYEKEKNKRQDIQTDSLLNSSFNYDLSRISLANKLNESFSTRWSLALRTDDFVKSNQLARATKALDIQFGGQWSEAGISRLDWRLAVRDFRVESDFQNNFKPTRSFIGSVNHNLNILKKGLVLNSYFESNTGQEPKFEFQYIKVQKGEGSYTWNDYNMDSLQTINEFVIAPFSDQADYEKITVFNNEFISINKNILNQTLKFEPGKILKNKNSFLGRTLISSRYRIDQKSSNENAGSLFRFVNFNFDDTVSIVSNNAVFDHNIFFNRGNPSYDVQLSYRTSENKFVQISGFERRSQKEYYARSRINLKRKVDAIVELRKGIKEYDSQNFDSQDFNIDYYSILPQVNYRPSTNLRIVGKYNFTSSKNMSTLEETSLAQDLGIELTWRQGSYSNLQFSFNFVNIDFTGQQNSPVEFEMLQGLKDGKNYLWQLNYTRRISNSIDLILNYDGRKSESNALINTAAVQLRAVF